MLHGCSGNSEPILQEELEEDALFDYKNKGKHHGHTKVRSISAEGHCWYKKKAAKTRHE